jgi:hypothetical protein
MPLILKTSQDTINISLEKYSGLSIEISGGIDSATLLYIISEYIEKNNLNLKLYAITIPNKTDGMAAYHSMLVIDFVKKKFPDVYIEHIINATIRTGGAKNYLTTKIRYELFRDQKIQGHIHGVTANPPDDSDFNFVKPSRYYIKSLTDRTKNQTKLRTIQIDNKDFDLLTPFGGIDKKGVCEITEIKNIKTKLLLITKSCTDKVEYQCGKCWWCQERAWGFDIEYNLPGKRIKFKYKNNK